MIFAYKQPVLGAARECHCEAEGRGNLDSLDCFASLAMTDSRRLCRSLVGCAARLVNRFSYFDEPRNRNRFTSRKGMTLTEMAVVIGIVAVMVGLTLPAANVLYNSFESTSGAKSMLNAALSSAKSIAIKEQRYAGIRFQKRYDPANPDPLNASQYIIFIVYDYSNTGLANGFRAVDGIQPIKLPDSIGVMDMLYNSIGGNNPDVNFTNGTVLRDTTAFSIVFSPSGKLVIHGVRVRNRNGQTSDSSNDDIFNTANNVVNGNAMFYQDDYWVAPSNLGFGPEPSRNSFYIYETKKFKQAYKSGVPYSGYLNQLKPAYVNPYTGTIVGQ
jgi:prepilin-type N-terminal cleavage/methylation domain-containing protein